ncbi:hypothetical protein [uncultured Methylobacterium sp.]|uniref:hypothetical protein n=1 Tax=uncultured Methylobacterium sp. TaxID=157278 RepID=UPI0035CBB506
MRYEALIVACLGCALAAIDAAGAAPETTRTEARALLSEGRSYVGRRIRLNNLSCVDSGGAGFVCTAEIDGQILSLTAPVLGVGTIAVISRKLGRDCKGTDKLQRSACRFDVEIKPTSVAKGSVGASGNRRPLVTVFAAEIDLF